MELCCWHQFAYQGDACLTMHVMHVAAMHVMHVAAMHVVHVAAMHVMHAAAMHQAYCQLVDSGIGISLAPLWSSKNKASIVLAHCTVATYSHRYITC